MTIMSVAHEVVAEDPTKISQNTEEDDNENPDKLKYQGPSPDEVTLVEFARERGFCFLSSNDTVVRMSNSVAGSVERPSIGGVSASDAALTIHGQASQMDDMMEFDQSNLNIPHRKAD